MDIFSELKQAQLEVLSVDPSPASNAKGRIYHKDTNAPIKVDDGTTIHKVLTDQMFTLVSQNLPANYDISSDSGSFNTTSSTFVEVTNLEATITTHGKPVEVFLVNGNVASIANSGQLTSSFFKLEVDGVELTQSYELANVSGTGDLPAVTIPGSAVRFFHIPSAGTHTYKLMVCSLSGSISTYITSCNLVAREL